MPRLARTLTAGFKILTSLRVGRPWDADLVVLKRFLRTGSFVGPLSLILILACQGSLAAQSLSSDRENDSFGGPGWSRTDAPSPVNAGTPPSRGTASTWQGDVIRADYQSPLPSGNSPAENRALPPADAGKAPEGGRAAGMPLKPAGHTTPLRLTPPGRAATQEAGRGAGRAGSLVTIGGSLALVVGLFLVFAWILRRTAPRGAAPLPAEVVEVLGRTVLAGRQQIQVLRFGRKLLLVSVTPAGSETLSEITDPDEVTRLLGFCQQSRPGSTTSAFRQVFEQLSRERTHDL
jgi:flagellar biogenesis protein FliO